MIKFTVMYPSGDGATFDHDYYVGRHIPMVADLLGDACKGIAGDRGVAGREPGAPPPYLAIAYLLFESVEEMQAAMGAAGPKLAEDGPNYTNTAAEVQISEV